MLGQMRKAVIQMIAVKVTEYVDSNKDGEITYEEFEQFRKDMTKMLNSVKPFEPIDVKATAKAAAEAANKKAKNNA